MTSPALRAASRTLLRRLAVWAESSDHERRQHASIALLAAYTRWRAMADRELAEERENEPTVLWEPPTTPRGKRA